MFVRLFFLSVLARIIEKVILYMGFLCLMSQFITGDDECQSNQGSRVQSPSHSPLVHLWKLRYSMPTRALQSFISFYHFGVFSYKIRQTFLVAREMTFSCRLPHLTLKVPFRRKLFCQSPSIYRTTLRQQKLRRQTSSLNKSKLSLKQ